MNRKKIELLIINILLPLAVGALAGAISGGGINAYEAMVKPSFSPPGFIFPIVWTILYILMGIAAFLVSSQNTKESQQAMKWYYLQLAVNFLWPIFFFSFGWYLFSFVWIILLIILIVKTIQSFYPISKTAAYLLIPYLIWVLFAAVLNFGVYYLNR